MVLYFFKYQKYKSTYFLYYDCPLDWNKIRLKDKKLSSNIVILLKTPIGFLMLYKPPYLKFSENNPNFQKNTQTTFMKNINESN